MLPASIRDEPELDEVLSRPTSAAVEALARLPGDILILGVGGKMGPTLARMVVRATATSSTTHRVFGVSRFSDGELRNELSAVGIETFAGNLLDRRFLESLPDAPNVIFMAGMKFGASGDEPRTWAMNAYLPAIVAERFANSRIAVFSTGNVYGLTPVTGRGSREFDPLNPVGEYAMSCTGRERMFEWFSRERGTPVVILRLNYANELRYGVLADLAQRIVRDEPIDLAMGHVNVIWQGDACAHTLCALEHCASPATILNIAGADVLRVADVARELGQRLGRTPRFLGSESDTALLNDASQSHALFGPPETSLAAMLDWVADWTGRSGRQLGKPTHFELRDGRF